MTWSVTSLSPPDDRQWVETLLVCTGLLSSCFLHYYVLSNSKHIRADKQNNKVFFNHVVLFSYEYIMS